MSEERLHPGMTLSTQLRWIEVRNLVSMLAKQLAADGHSSVYGIPRGGQVVAGLLIEHSITAADRPAAASAIVDDILDSGDTAKRWGEAHDKPVYPLMHKQPGDGWIVFPWEEQDEHLVAAHDSITRLLEVLGQDVASEGLRDTPKRVLALYREMLSGERVVIDDILGRTFEAMSDEIVTVRDIPFYSLCEHHLAPFFGSVTIGYLPQRANRGKHGGPYSVLGLSKLARLVHAFSRRLQLQERMTYEIADALHQSPELRPRGVGVLVRGQHLCMKMRGVRSDGEMVTSALLGEFRETPEVRAEWLALARG